MGQSLGQIRALLGAAGLTPKHRLGQNFLHDGNQMSRIVKAAEIKPGQLVLEVGPGTGALTERLLDIGATVVAVEVDRDLEPILRQRLAGYGQQVTLVIGDVLTSKHVINEAVLGALREAGGSLQKFKLVANLPYQIASPLLINLAVGSQAVQMAGAVVTVQQEVAGRLIAQPGGKTYGPLSVMVQAMCEVQGVGVIGPRCFWPEPKVQSAVVRLSRREKPLTGDPLRLSQTVRQLFGQRRKQLGTIVGRGRALPSGIELDQRPEQLSVEQLEALSVALC